MKIDVHLDDKDYIEFNIFYIYHSRHMKKLIFWGRFAVLFLSLAVMLVFIVSGVRRTLILWQAAGLSLASILWFILYPRQLKKTFRREIVSWKHDGRLPYSPSATYDFGEEQITESAPGLVRSISYADVTAIHEAEEYVYVMTGAQEGIILPHRDLGDRREELLRLLRSKVHLQK